MKEFNIVVIKVLSNLISTNVSTKQHKNSINSCIVVTSVTTKPHTSMLLGFINNQYTRISNLIVNNVSTKQQKGSSEGAHSIETLGD